MKQDKIYETTKKATEAPLKLTRSMVEQSKKLRTPSPQAAKIGTAIGYCAGGVLLLTGTIQLLTGRPLWALGTLSAGLITVISNLFCYMRRKNKTS